MEIETIASHGAPVNPYGRFVIEKRGNSEPFFADLSLHFDDMRHMLVANDGYGRPQWEVSLVEDGQRLNFGYQRSLVQRGPRVICCWSCWVGKSWRSIRWVSAAAARRACCGPRT